MPPSDQMPPASSAATSAQYEFTEPQNRVIADLARAMTWISAPLALLGYLYLIALVLEEDMPPMTLRLRLLQLTGMSTPEALDKLGVRRENRSRVISGQTGGASKRMQNRRSTEDQNRIQMDDPLMRPNGCGTADERQG